MTISVIIPSYKNELMLIQNLKNNINFLKDFEIIVVNDDPTADIEKIIKQHSVLNRVKIINNEKNSGFSQSINRGIMSASGKYVFLLNNDVVIHDSGFISALKYFDQDQDLFAISFCQKEKDDTLVGKNRIFWKNGFFQHAKTVDHDFGITAWAEGGSSLIDRQKYINLKGFDSLYSPFYWEDIDLSYRAWKNGYKIIFSPATIFSHYHNSTIGKFYSRDYIDKISFRNQLLFIWKNIHDRKLILDHIVKLLPNLIVLIFNNKLNLIAGFFEALFKMPSIKRQPAKISDKKILDKFYEK
jgi:GT2 family glycosyltransferase